MAVKIRLKRMGAIRTPHYRIVVMDSRTKRDGRAIEEIGKYHPKNDPSFIEVNSERAQYWLSVGAQPTEAVVAILKRSGDWQAFTGDKTPSGIEPQKQKADKTERFNKALADTKDEPTVEAFSKKKASEGDKPEAKADDAELEAKADEETSSDEAKSDDAAADEAKADAKSDEA
ncbi:30S ribosomal protein S16 [Mariniluteicoccus flavus]